MANMYEKAIALTTGELDQLMQLNSNSLARVMEGFMYRFSSAMALYW